MAWRTLLDALRERAASQPNRPALWRKSGDSPYRASTWGELASSADRFGRGLIALGLPAGKPLAAILGPRPEWPALELGAMGAGLVPAPLFDSWPPARLAELLARLEACAVVVEGGAQLERLRALRASLPSLRLAIVLDPQVARDERERSFAQVLELGGQQPEAPWLERLAGLDPSATAALSVTPGTAGEPRLVEHSHAALLAHARRFARATAVGSEDTMLARLSPAHALERSVWRLWLACGAQMHVAPARGGLRAQLADARPSFVHASPEDWEALRRTLEEKLAAEAPNRRKVLGWARRAALDKHRLEDDYLAVPGTTLAKVRLAQTLVFQPLKLEAGLHAARLLLCGLGPMRAGTLEFFTSLDLPLDEAWGSCEVGGPIALSAAGARRLGTQGRPLPGVAVRIAFDGEILLQSDTSCTVGAARDRHGWLRTGDQGELDCDGFLRVLGRREEQLVLRGRRRTPALVVEARLRAMPLVSQALAFADGRAPVALLELDRERCARFAREHGLPDDPAELCLHPSLLAQLDRELAEAQAEAPETERVRRFAPVPDGFRLEEGERTPTGTLCRKVVARRRAELLGALLERAERAKG